MDCGSFPKCGSRFGAAPRAFDFRACSRFKESYGRSRNGVLARYRIVRAHQSRVLARFRPVSEQQSRWFAALKSHE
eukprot:8153045-Pyramimonas_sp.AAC.1